MTPRSLDDLTRRVPVRSTISDTDAMLQREWLVTNGLGGYASGTVAGIITRRFHGLLIAALPNPAGRTMMLNRLEESLIRDDGSLESLSGMEGEDGELILDPVNHITEFRLEGGLPVWRYEIGDVVLEKRIVMPYRQNTTLLRYALLDGPAHITLSLTPAVHFRPHEATVDAPLQAKYRFAAESDYFALESDTDLPPMRLWVDAPWNALALRSVRSRRLGYRQERHRGYEHAGTLWVPGTLEVRVEREAPMTLTVSVEDEEVARALTPEEAFAAERDRRRRVLYTASPGLQKGFAAELVLAADQFLVRPVGRSVDVARADAFGDDVRTIIAGYHWFTDWGRDTMISLEGLTLTTGRHTEAGYILRTFARYIRDGLIPNMFPEGRHEGLYHTADATLWYFHAVHRYVQVTGDRWTLRLLLPALREIVRRHVAGTHFGIGVDPHDGLLRQGAEGFQLTWMDAKVDDWVVTPRRGKAVEVNALWFNALRLLEGWLREEGGDTDADYVARLAERACSSFNRRFWNAGAGYCYDIVDGEDGDDDALRPNQLLAISLSHPVLDPGHWHSVLDVTRERLLTPVGLRSLAPGHADYRERYDGDLRARDAAYHQGTVWGWLIGPWIDAWLRVHPNDLATARGFLSGFEEHLMEFGTGSIAEIFDGEAPFTPRGCIAQAWSVAEVLRCLTLVTPAGTQKATAEGVEFIAAR